MSIELKWEIRAVIIQKSQWAGYALIWTDRDFQQCPSQTASNRLLFHWAICLTVPWLDKLSYAGKCTSIGVFCNEWLLLIRMSFSKKPKNTCLHMYLMLETNSSFRTSWVKQKWNVHVITICIQVCFRDLLLYWHRKMTYMFLCLLQMHHDVDVTEITPK